MEDIRYPYKPRAGMMVVGTLFFGALTAVTVLFALTDHDQVTIRHSYTLRGDEADIFRWGLCIAMAALVLFFAWMTWRALTSRHVLKLDRDAIHIPGRGRDGTSLRIPYPDITNVTVSEFKSYAFVEIHHNGQTTRISSALLPRGAFEIVLRFLKERMDAATP